MVYSFDWNNITSKGASILFDTFKFCKSSLNKLVLSWNQLDDDCMKPLGEYIQSNPKLERLWIGSNNISDKGLDVLSTYLIGNMSLKYLNILVNKGITNKSAPWLTKIIMNSAITDIDFQGTSISDDKQEEMTKYLQLPVETRSNYHSYIKEEKVDEAIKFGNYSNKLSRQIKHERVNHNKKHVDENVGLSKDVIERSNKTVIIKESTTIFIGNLHPQITVEQIKKLFEPCGAIKDVRLGRDRDTGEFKRFAYVEFNDCQGVMAALTNNGVEYMKYKIRIDIDRKKQIKKNAKNKDKGLQGNGILFGSSKQLMQ